MSYMYDTHSRKWRSGPQAAESRNVSSWIVDKSNKIFINMRGLSSARAYDMYDMYDIPRGNQQPATGEGCAPRGGQLNTTPAAGGA